MIRVDFPGPLDTDSENVEWLLSTAASLWKKGEREESLRWLERAIAGATEDGNAARATELSARARALAEDGAKKTAAASAPAAPPKPKGKPFTETLVSDRPPGLAPPPKPKATPTKTGADDKPPPSSATTTQKAAAARAAARGPAKPQETVIEPAPASVDIVLSTRDMMAGEAASDPAVTRRFDYDEGLDPAAMASAILPGSAPPAAPAPALPANVLPGIRVWIVPGPEGGKVVPAEGGRPRGATDAILLAVVPGIDLYEALARKS